VGLHQSEEGGAGAAEATEGKALQAAILTVLGKATADRVWQDREAFSDRLKAILRRAGHKLPTPLFNAIVGGLSERDEAAEPCMKAGSPEPDADLRDTRTCR